MNEERARPYFPLFNYNTWYDIGYFSRYSEKDVLDTVRIFGEELVQMTRDMFPLSHKREDTFIGGLSMGGYGALLHGLTNPGRYNAIGAFSPGIPLPFPEFPPISGRFPKQCPG